MHRQIYTQTDQYTDKYVYRQLNIHTGKYTSRQTNRQPDSQTCYRWTCNRHETDIETGDR